MAFDPENTVNGGDLTSRSMTVRLPVPASRPAATYVMAGILVFIWLTMTVVGLLTGLGLGGSQNVRVLVLMGAKVNALIVAGQYWRLLTANFLHIGFLHLAFNTYALIVFGTDMERRYGHWRFLALYLLAGLGGSVLSFLANDAIAAGASGAIFGLLGAMIAYLITYRDEFGDYGRRRLSSLFLVAGYNLLMGFVMPGIDYFGHIGGLLTGLILGWAYCPRYEVEADYGVMPHLRDGYPRPRALAVTLLVIVLLGALLAWGVRRGA